MKTAKEYENYLNIVGLGMLCTSADFAEYDVPKEGQRLLKQGKLGTALRRYNYHRFLKELCIENGDVGTLTTE